MVDVGNNRVQRFDAFVRYLGKLGRQGDGDGEFSSPGDVVVDNNNGWVFVVDPGNHRVQRLDSTLRFLGTWGEEGDGDGQLNRSLQCKLTYFWKR